jgi:hypothetical protein
MYDLKTNLEPGNPEGHTVLRYLVEVKQMPLEVAIERVYYTVDLLQKSSLGYNEV